MVLAVFSATAARAEDPPPLFPDLGLPRAEHFAAACVGNGAAPHAGAWCATVGLLEGAHPRVQRWDFFGPLSIRAGRTQVGAATLFLSGFTPAHGLTRGIGEVSLLHAGNSKEDLVENCWTLIDTEICRPVPDLLKEVAEDGKPMFNGTLETEVFIDTLVQAYYTSTGAFGRAARRDLTFAQIFEEPRKFRGVVIHIKGELGRLARHDPPPEAVARGVTDLYQADIFYDAQGLNPFVALFTDLPPRLRPYLGEKRLGEKKIEVSFDGYFFKKFRAKAGDSKANTARDYPVFIGKSLVIATLPPQTAEDNWSSHLMVAFVGFVLFVVVGIILLTWWFRRSDDRARRRLAALREANLVLPTPEIPAEPALQSGTPPENGTSGEGRFGGRLGEFSGPAE
jgi:hypothetical protein